MKKGQKIINKVDQAFSESLRMIGLKRGKNEKDVCLRVRFVGEKNALELGLFNLKKVVRLHHSELFSSKVTALRLGIEDIYFSLMAFCQMTKERYEIKPEEDIAVLVYESPRAQKPIVVCAVDGKLKHSMFLSDLMAILGIGDELLN